MTEEATTAHQDTKPGRLPIYLSALVLPGAGQFAQRRPLAGLFFSVAFVACFAVFIIYVFRIILAFYSLGLDFSTYETSDVMRTPRMGAALAFLAAVGVYAVSLIDTYGAFRRQSRRWSARRWHVEKFQDAQARGCVADEI